MTARIRLRPRQGLLLAVAGLLGLLAIGWFGFLAPAGATSSGLDRQIAATRAQIAAPSVPIKPGTPTPSTLLSTAIPRAADTPGLLRELSVLAAAAKVTLDSISPQPAKATSTLATLPMTVVVHGGFFAVSDFLRRLQGQVSVHGGRLTASGRLIEVQAVDLEQIQPASQLSATITLLAFSTAGASSRATSVAAGATGP